jgi:hypothetical protein
MRRLDVVVIVSLGDGAGAIVGGGGVHDSTTFPNDPSRRRVVKATTMKDTM